VFASVTYRLPVTAGDPLGLGVGLAVAVGLGLGERVGTGVDVATGECEGDGVGVGVAVATGLTTVAEPPEPLQSPRPAAEAPAMRSAAHVRAIDRTGRNDDCGIPYPSEKANGL
jgi:hypothetical protein